MMKFYFPSLQTLFFAVLLLTFSASKIQAQYIIDVDPNKAKIGQNLDVVISGHMTHFGQGTSVLETSVWLSQATGTTPTHVIFPNTVTINSLTKLTANFSIGLGEPMGDYHVNIVNSADGNVTLPYGFNINNNPVGIGEFKEQYQLDIFPNPVSTQLNVKLNLPKASKVNYKLVDIMGKEVFNKQVNNAAAGQQLQRFDLDAKLAAGTYYLQVQVNDDVVVQPVVKQ